MTSFSVEDVRYRFIYDYFFSIKMCRLTYKWLAYASGQQSKKSRWVFSFLATSGDKNMHYGRFSGKQSPLLTQHLRNMHGVLVWYFLHEQKDIVSGFQIKKKWTLNSFLTKNMRKSIQTIRFGVDVRYQVLFPFYAMVSFSLVASSIWRQFPI